VRKVFLIFFIICLLSSCSKRIIASTDSTKIIVHTDTICHIDTLIFTLPHIEQSNVTLDTTSFLENKFASSKALVSNNILSHTLNIKPVQHKVEYIVKEVVRDSVVEHVVKDTEYVEVEKKLTLFQRITMSAGISLYILLLLVIVYIIIKKCL